MIGSLVSKIYGNIEKHIRVCFFSAFICGFFAHMYALTNHLYNYDELWHIPAGFGTGVQIGRWGLSVLAWLTKVLFKDVYTIPAINGLVAIVLYAIVACVAVKMFEITDIFFAGAVGALITTFPAITCRNFSMFTTHYYAIGECIAAIGILLFVRCKNKVAGGIAAIAMLVFSVSVYQTAFVTAACLLLGYLMTLMLKKNLALKEAIIECGSSVVLLGLSMVLYLISNKIVFAITGLGFEKHSENYDTMGQISVSQLISSLARCYKSFLRIGFSDVYSMNPNIISKVGFLVCEASIVYVLVKLYKKEVAIYQKILFVLMILVLPVGVNLIYIMAAASGTMYSIMTFGMVFIMIIPIALVVTIQDGKQEDNQDEKKNVLSIDMLVSEIMAAVVGLSVLTFIWFANGNYLAIQYTNQHDNAYYQTIMTQMKSVTGYRDDMPITMIGKPVNDLTNSRGDMIGQTFSLACKSGTNVAAYSSWNIMTRILGYDPMVRDSDEDEAYFRGLEEVRNMSCYPDWGSMKIIDDTLVIKFQEVEELEN